MFVEIQFVVHSQIQDFYVSGDLVFSPKNFGVHVLGVDVDECRFVRIDSEPASFAPQFQLFKNNLTVQKDLSFSVSCH